MASRVYKLSEWQDAIGVWRVAHTDSVKYARWWIVPFALKMSYEEYIKMLKEKYHASHFSFSSFEDNRNSLLVFGFDKYEDAHRYLLDMNRYFRKINLLY